MLINSNTTFYILIGDSFGIGHRQTQTKKKTKRHPQTPPQRARLLIIQGNDFNYTENTAF